MSTVAADRPAHRPAYLSIPETELAEHLCVALAGVVWLLILTPSSGGLHDARTALLSAVLVPALLLVRPWRSVRPLLLVAVPTAAAGALLALLLGSPGWSQADSVGSQLTGLLGLVLVAGYARTRARRLAVAAVVLAAGVLQSWPAWFAWWGGHDPDRLAVGTFFWHNQFGIYMAAVGAVAGAIAVLDRGRLRWCAATVATMAGAGVVLSTSRTTLGLWLVSLLALAGLAWTSPTRRASLAMAAGLPCLTAALLLVLTSSQFFPGQTWQGPPVLGLAAPVHEGTSPSPSFSVAGSRDAASLGSNGGDRVAWTRAALSAWVDSPIIGHGFGSFEETSDRRLPDDTIRSPWVHNGPVEALTSGGLAFGGPLILVMLILGIRSLNALMRPGRLELRDRGVRAGAALGTLMLLAHTLVDFDWHYSSLFVLLGVTGGLVVAYDTPRTSTRATAHAVALCATAALATVATLVERFG